MDAPEKGGIPPDFRCSGKYCDFRLQDWGANVLALQTVKKIRAFATERDRGTWRKRWFTKCDVAVEEEDVKETDR